MKQALIFLLVAFAITSCKKEEADNRKYSTWYINGQKFSSNNNSVTRSTGATGWECVEDGVSLFYFMFVHYIAPREPMALSNGRTTQSKCDFQYNGSVYDMRNGKYIIVYPILASGRVQFDLDTTWFYNYYNPKDSIRIWGTFTEP